MDRGTIKLIVENGHFIGYDINHKKKVRRTVLTAQATADRILERESSGFFEKKDPMVAMATGS
ncbi:hypothetical protein Dpep_0383 [Dethiosulfovibrio peptidovorans DSM 11002]|uniref:Uncharacterized protein n=1 Tax=Dethiosulfovibrio peptidovorans DSM 11002 TaxID=469381 RepID=D2Z3V9_9BACT|nr:hypothetical protein [Dethiosulfovibrio peptidovorans]EFC90415.1 hypothetical protein Dpep_0383 [Dethiosulfovibrio peptidovorans DSM 11002]